MERFHGLHPDFIPAHWVGTCSSDGEYVGVTFNLDDGSSVRLAIDSASCGALIETVAVALNHPLRMNSQSDSASGSPSVEVSAQRECEKV